MRDYIIQKAESPRSIHRWIIDGAIQGLVSVIVPTYNRGQLIVQTLESVSNQSYRPIELVIINDGSTDNTKEIVESWQRQFSPGESFKIKYIYQPNNGASAARNRGTSESNGEFIQFLDSDDLLHPRKIEIQVKHALRVGQSVYGETYRFAQKGDGIAVYPAVQQPRPESLLSDWLGGAFIPVHSFLWRRGDIEFIGKWDESLSLDDDGEFAMRFLLNSGTWDFCKGSWSFYRLLGDGRTHISTNYNENALLALLRTIRRIESGITENGELEIYRDSLAKKYWSIARYSAWCTRPRLDALKHYRSLRTSRIPPVPILDALCVLLIGIRGRALIASLLKKYCGVAPFREFAELENVDALYRFVEE